MSRTGMDLSLRTVGLFRRKSTKNGIKEALRIGPTLKDFLASSQAVSETGAADLQWDKAPYLRNCDVAGKGRKGEFSIRPFSPTSE